jgi:hypothetical protein
MKTILRIFLFSLWAALIGFWPGGAGAQIGALGRCGLASSGGVLGLAPGSAAAHAAMIKRTLKCLQATGQAPAKGSPGAGGRFVTFDPPGSTSTIPSGITPDGTITGYYSDTSGVQHGFLRDRNGSFTTFDPLGSTATTPTSISPSGEIAGAYCDTAGCSGIILGFVRATDGTFTTFGPPGGMPYGVFAGIYSPGGTPSINPAGAIAGTYSVASPSYAEHGFLRDKNGAFTTIDVPGASLTELLAINPSGTMVGDFSNQTTFYTGFIRTPDGSFTTIDAPGSVACGGGTVAVAINPAGAVAGITQDPTCSVPLGYLRTPDGTVTTFGVPSVQTFAQTFQTQAINPAGLIIGWIFDNSGFHGFLRTLDGAITPFDVPSSFGTAAFEINASGAIIGFYFDANGVTHGFLRLP